MRTIKHFLMVATLIFSTWNIQAQERITNVADVAAYYASNPTAYPTRDGRTMATLDGKPGDGWTPVYSKANPVNSTGELLMVRGTNDTTGVYRLADNDSLGIGSAFLGIIAGSREGILSSIYEPVWDRSGDPARADWIWFHDHNWPRFGCQKWSDPTTYQQRGSAPAGMHFINGGGEGDLSDDGRFMAVKLIPSVGGYVGGHFVNVKVGVIDLVAGKVLPGLVDGNPNAIDITPDGRWLAMLPHAAALAEALNVHRRSRAQAQSALEQTFKDLQAKPLNPRDVEGMTRLLSLRKAILSMKGEAGQKSAHVLDDLKATVKPKGPKR